MTLLFPWRGHVVDMAKGCAWPEQNLHTAVAHFVGVTFGEWIEAPAALAQRAHDIVAGLPATAAPPLTDEALPTLGPQNS